MKVLKDSGLMFALFYMSVVVIIVAGLKIASEIVVLFFLSIIIASVFSALLNYFSKKGFPKIVGYFIIFTIIIFMFVLLSYVIGHSLKDLSLNMAQYQSRLKVLAVDILNGDNKLFGLFEIDKKQIIDNLDFKPLLTLSATFIGGIGSFMSKLLLLTIGVAFILAESKSFQKKLFILFKGDKSKIKSFQLFSTNIQKYFLIKTFTSFLTGLIITIVLLYFGIDYPVLWGVLAFILNFIPVVGSLVAAIPALILSLVYLDLISTIWLGLIYFIVNISISNIIEPKLMGKGLGLSPMFIFFSLIFWGWVLGIAGMFLAIPLTMTLKIAFDSASHTKWLGVLLSDISKNKD